MKRRIKYSLIHMLAMDINEGFGKLLQGHKRNEHAVSFGTALSIERELTIYKQRFVFRHRNIALVKLLNHSCAHIGKSSDDISFIASGTDNILRCALP